MSILCYVRCAECAEQAEYGIADGMFALSALVDQGALLCLLFNHLEKAGFGHVEAWADTFGYSSNFHFALAHAPHMALQVVNEKGGVYEWKLSEARARKDKRRG